MWSSPPNQTNARGWGPLSVLLIVALVALALWIYSSHDTTWMRGQWLGVVAVITGLCIVVGLMVNSRPDGILIDDRNRISLERAQWVAWLIVLLSGYFVEAIWNVTHVAAIATGPDAGRIFPRMQTDLFLLLGIVSVSPVISNVIVDNKKNQNPGGAGSPAAVAPPSKLADNDNPRQLGVMDANKSPADASWADLYLGEEVANRYVVDISRLQKLIITVLLVLAYSVSLWRLFGRPWDPKTPFALFDMPEVGRDFIALLGISHGAYLASKSTTKTPASNSA